mmetsp:Transcript_91095/g.175362  ORF Transcript_91095/g.175362 Transcript_91095/m.175362 type:complete len:84 (+) Transcript_91095:1276-1527(+)
MPTFFDPPDTKKEQSKLKGPNAHNSKPNYKYAGQPEPDGLDKNHREDSERSQAKAYVQTGHATRQEACRRLGAHGPKAEATCA